MAWRIPPEHVVRGDLDNRVKGQVTGNIWLAGCEQPLVLTLSGNFQPDIAGCRLTFENPSPIPITSRPPAVQQRGDVGDITASRKTRVLDVSTEEACAMLKRGETPPEHIANVLYLAWLTKTGGRIVIEAPSFQFDVSEPRWRFTPAELEELRCATAEAESLDGAEEDDDGHWDEFRHEQLLRETDMVGEKFRRLLEKYADHPDRDEIVAHEMGWERIGEEISEENAARIDELNEIFEEALESDAGDEPPDPAREGIDWIRDDQGRISHPLAKRTREFLYALMEELKAGGEDLASTDEAIGGFIGELMTLSVKLSAHLEFIARGDRLIDAGMLIAWLKRDLEIHNQTLAAGAALEGHPRISPARLDDSRAELMAIREAVLAIISDLRQEGI